MYLKRFLVLDDAVNLCEILAQIIKILYPEASVAMAPDGKAGLEEFKKCPADFIFSDVIMPGMNGVEFLEKMMALDPTIPIIMMTGYCELNQEDFFAKGARGFLMKPFTINDVHAAIMNVTNAEAEAN